MRYLLLFLVTWAVLPQLTAQAKPMNFVVIFVDDLGYGDIGPFGSPHNRTPHLDRMAKEGRKLTSFYVGACVCTPSRAALMTGCYPQRVDMGLNALPTSVNNIVLFPGDPKGLNPSEWTIAEVLKQRRYHTACIGKWHLGDQPPFLPTQQGFDEYFGIPFSNDMGFDNRIPYPPLPLLRNEEVIETEPDQRQLTRRYTEEAIQFMEQHQTDPFFLYLPHSMVHWPHYASAGFEGQSKNGIYGDVVEEIDWSVGKILEKLRELQLADHTLVLFTSDNGGGGARGESVVSNLPLRGRKGSLCEGGIRVCTLAWCPGRIPAGTTCNELMTAMDLLPTFAHLAEAPLPPDRTLDGKNVAELLFGGPQAETPHEAFFYRRGLDLHAVRSGPWKLFLRANRIPLPGDSRPTPIPAGALFHLERDLGETTDVAADHPDVVARLQALADAAREDLGDGPTAGKNVRPAAYVPLAQARPLTDFTAEHGFTSLFDGKTLQGWRTAPADATAAWEVRDGVIHGEGKEDRLVYLVYAEDESLRNFELAFKYRMVTPGNTGVEVRTRIDRTGKRPFEGYHADLGHVGIGPQVLGAWDFHFGHDTRREHACPRGTRLTITAKDEGQRRPIARPLVPQKHIHAGEWNDGYIVARDNHFELYINRKLSAEFTDLRATGQLERGFIGLQLHDKGMIVQFKDLYLKKL